MVVAGAHLLTQFQSIISRRVNPLDSGVITVGKIEAGTKQNVIAETARLEGTIRALSPATMAMIKQEIEHHVKGVEMAFNCEAAIDYGANYYQVYNHPEQTQAFIAYCEAAGYDLVICPEAMTGEDFGYFLKEIPGFMFWLGVQSEAGLHSSNLIPDESAIEVGVRAVAGYLTMLGDHE
jgi:N-acetyldiaminopimelate deacetylase